MDTPWWKSAVVYQIYPRSFCDSNGDGVGDLAGVRSKLDHLERLGVDAVWLSPFFRSPMRDFGYDVSDYCDVDPLFGDLADFDALVADCHARGIRVVIDWVPNHSSDLHPWFQEARASRSAPKRDWYIWRDGTPDTPPNNWRSAFTRGPAWTWDEATEQWYLHLFLEEQPDLNWRNPQLVEAMHDTLRFWLDRGVDGFRMDVIHCIGKDPALPDVDAKLAPIPYCALNDHPSTHELLRGIRGVLESYPGERTSIGEVYLLDTDRVATYADPGELHLAFNFPPLYAAWTAPAWHDQIERAERAFGSRDAWPTWVLSNHDNPRHRTRYGSEARARAAAVLLLTLRGAPFLYAGEELGLEDAVIEKSRQVDPGGRDGCRAPIPWDGSQDHGWSGSEPWLPWPPERERRHAEQQWSEPDSILALYRALLAARRASSALRTGTWTALPAPEAVLFYKRESSDDARFVAINFSDEPQAISPPLALRVEISSGPSASGAAFRGRLSGDEALILAIDA